MKTTIYTDNIEVLSNGVVCARRVTLVTEEVEGEEIAICRGFHRYALTPGQDIADQPDEVKTVCAETWTPDVVAAYEASLPVWSPEQTLNLVRAARDVAASRLDGIAGRMARAGDTTGIAAACDAAIVALLNITSVPAVRAATDEASLSAALRAEYERIATEAALASPDLVKAFAGFNL